MKQTFMGLVVLLGVTALWANDGTWLSSTEGGEWSSIDNWAGGVIAGNGGVATFSMTAGGKEITSSMTLSLSGITVSVSGGQDLKFKSGTFSMTPAATLFVSSGIAIFEDAVISTADDLIISGDANARFQFNTAQQITGRLKLSGGWLRATDDACLGPARSAYAADAIVMDGGTLQNNSG